MRRNSYSSVITAGRGIVMKARLIQIRFFFAIVFRSMPHGGLLWPWRAWGISRHIYCFWRGR
jgi:hypothetical protein